MTGQKGPAHSSVLRKSAQMPEKTAEGMKMSRPCQKSAPRLAGLQLKESDQSSREGKRRNPYVWSGYINFLSPEFPRSFCSCHRDELSGTPQRRERRGLVGGQKSRKLGGRQGRLRQMCGHMAHLRLSPLGRLQTIEVGQDESY